VVSQVSRRSLLADRTNGRAIGTVLRLSVCLSVTLCIVAKRCVLEQKLLLRAYSTVVHSGHLFPKPTHYTTVLKCCVVAIFSQHNSL